MAQEEKYEEAKRLYKTANADQRYVLEKLFPEFKESDDERIKREIIEYIKTGTYHKDWIAWLEKQGEQKPFEMITAEESLGISSEEYNKIVDECIYGEYKSK